MCTIKKSALSTFAENALFSPYGGPEKGPMELSEASEEDQLTPRQRVNPNRINPNRSIG